MMPGHQIKIQPNDKILSKKGNPQGIQAAQPVATLAAFSSGISWYHASMGIYRVANHFENVCVVESGDEKPLGTGGYASSHISPLFLHLQLGQGPL